MEFAGKGKESDANTPCSTTTLCPTTTPCYTTTPCPCPETTPCRETTPCPETTPTLYPPTTPCVDCEYGDKDTKPPPGYTTTPPPKITCEDGLIDEPIVIITTPAPKPC